MNIIYSFGENPNIDLLNERVVWWNEKYICIKQKGEYVEQY